MLPYTPLHHLLLRDLGLPLVMTSGNVSDEPIAYEDDRLLLESVVAGLSRRNLRALVPSRIPPNDGRIAYGQAVVAAARRR